MNEYCLHSCLHKPDTRQVELAQVPFNSRANAANKVFTSCSWTVVQQHRERLQHPQGFIESQVCPMTNRMHMFILATSNAHGNHVLGKRVYFMISIESYEQQPL